MGSRRIATAAVAGAVLATLGLVVSGCGSSGSPAASPPATTTGATSTNSTSTNSGPGARRGLNSAAFSAYQSCLKAHGVTLPAGRGFGGRRGAGGAPPTGTGTAPTGTSPTGTSTTPRQPGGFGAFGGRTLTAKQRAALTACRSKLPAGARGGFGGGFGRGGGATGPNANPAFARYTACLARHGVKFGSSSAGSTTFAKAQAACRTLLPTPGAGTTTTATTTTAGG